jgi:hypothetical protein
MVEFAVMGEKHDGEVICIARGFSSEEQAKDHRMTRKGWFDVWVEEIGEPRPYRPGRSRRFEDAWRRQHEH